MRFDGMPPSLEKNIGKIEEKLKMAAKIGMPEAVEDRVTFYWKSNSTYTVPIDPSGIPYHLDDVPIDEFQRAPVQVVTTIETVHRVADGNDMGEFNNPRARFGVFSSEIDQVRDADYVTYCGDRYEINYVEVPTLGSMGLYIHHCTALDAS